MHVLQASGLRKTFEKGKERVEAVRGVSLSIAAGEILAFLGPNGAGKTTTIKMVAGLIIPDAGAVAINGLDPHRDAAAQHHLGAVLEGSRNLYMPLTAHANLTYFARLKGLSRREAIRRADQLLAEFNLTDKANSQVNDLSRGMQQKLAIAVSLVHAPKLLLLDEPTLGLDVEAAIAVRQQLRELAARGHAILLTTHQLDVAQAVADRVAIIRGGTLIAQDATSALVGKFCGQGYSIYVEGTPQANQVQALTALGATSDDGVIHFAGEPQALYAVLAALQPLAINRVERGDADLESVFLRIIKNVEVQS